MDNLIYMYLGLWFFSVAKALSVFPSVCLNWYFNKVSSINFNHYSTLIIDWLWSSFLFNSTFHNFQDFLSCFSIPISCGSKSSFITLWPTNNCYVLFNYVWHFSGLIFIISGLRLLHNFPVECLRQECVENMRNIWG